MAARHLRVVGAYGGSHPRMPPLKQPPDPTTRVWRGAAEMRSGKCTNGPPRRASRSMKAV